ncbi:TetR/AcrR family transcriptional regulator [Actinoplanes oblitus]|uniref:TetR/AcrR family transcriptional regulator n=1 Tax=Actinoplanes oblitus TaxID=3040509 RepID=A0ABY8WQE1_9ACTN|nr:TetR/AcrR family transcriptional regulator [Actinoplanes oblitus]WIM99662.1 TetR/AcrR family transcriptional regulator [Actinoplanes oblitus]
MSRPTDPRVLRSRASVLTSALALLAERGVAGTTIEAVAERSGVAKTTIYRQWDSQTTLVLDAFDSVLAAPSDPATGSLRDDLVQLLTGFAEALRVSPATGLMFALIDAAERDPAFAALHRRQAENRHRLILRVLARGIERGELSADADPADLLDLLAGPIFHRRAVTGRTLDAAFAERVVDRVLIAYRVAT